jgi:hypothetical protein
MRSDEKGLPQTQISRVNPQLVRKAMNLVTIGGERFSWIRSSATENWLR